MLTGKGIVDLSGKEIRYDFIKTIILVEVLRMKWNGKILGGKYKNCN